MATTTNLHIRGASELELFELEELLGDTELAREPEQASTSADHGDLGLTAAVVIVSTAAIHAVAVWLAKRSEGKVERGSMRLEKRVDGTVILDITHVSRAKVTESPDPKVVAALRTQLASMFASVPGLSGASPDPSTSAHS